MAGETTAGHRILILEGFMMTMHLRLPFFCTTSELSDGCLWLKPSRLAHNLERYCSVMNELGARRCCYRGSAMRPDHDQGSWPQYLDVKTT